MKVIQIIMLKMNEHVIKKKNKTGFLQNVFDSGITVMQNNKSPWL